MKPIDLFLLLVVLISCSPAGKRTQIEPDTPNVLCRGKFSRSVIFNKRNAEKYEKDFKADGFWTPAAEDIDTVENEIMGFLEGLGAEKENLIPQGTRKFLSHNIKRYTCQYIGTVRNDQRYIRCNFFIDDDRFKGWERDWIFHEENYHYWGILYNYDLKEIESVTCN